MTQVELLMHLERLYPNKVRVRGARYAQIEVEEFASDGDGYCVYGEVSKRPGMVHVTDGGSTGMRMWTDEMERNFKSTAEAVCSNHEVGFHKGEIHKHVPLESVPEAVQQVIAAMKVLDP